MASTTTDRLAGVTASLASKAPVRAATTANITLSGAQTIDGVAVVADDRVLVKNQTDGIENGIYDAKSGAWVRSLDFDGTRDVRSGTFVVVASGTAGAGTLWRITTADDITIGTTSIAFALMGNDSASAFMATVLDDGDALTARTTLGAERAHMVNVLDKGATGDGVTDDTIAINAAISANQKVYFPPGTYLISAVMTLASNLTIFGAGPGVTTIKLADSSDAHMFEGVGVNHVEIAHLTLDGNRANQTVAVHGIRGDGAQDWWLHDLEILGARGYGIGFQAGTMTRLYMDRIRVDGSGSDGIDFKNVNNANVNNFLSNIHVNNPGTVLATQAAVDLRGDGFVLSNITVDGLTGAHRGIRFRESSATITGGRRSSLASFFIDGTDTANSQGLVINAQDVHVSDGFIRNVDFGVVLDGDANSTPQEISIVGVQAFSCATDGFSFDDISQRVKVIGCVAQSCGGDGFDIDGNDIYLSGCTAIGNTGFGLRIGANANNLNHVGNNWQTTGSGAVSDSGTGTTGRNNIGYLTENSGTGTIANATTSVVITHGLGPTPLAQHISVIGTENPTNDVGTIWIDTITSTQFTVNVEADPGASAWSFGWHANIVP